MTDAPKPALRLLERNAPDQAMNFVAGREQMLRKIAAVLPRNPGDQRLPPLQVAHLGSIDSNAIHEIVTTGRDPSVCPILRRCPARSRGAVGTARRHLCYSPIA